MQQTESIIINAIEYTVPTNAKYQLKHFEDQLDRPIVSPLDFTQEHVDYVVRVTRGEHLLPIDSGLLSHKTALRIVQLSQILGISQDLIELSFNDWVTTGWLFVIAQPEYLFPLYVACEAIVDFNVFFQKYPKPFHALLAAKNLPEVRADPKMYIDLLIFLKQLDIESCFDENNDKVQRRIYELTKERKLLQHEFLVNPYEDFLAGYTQYTPTYYDMWDCKDISVLEAPEYQSDQLAPEDVALARVETFTRGLLRKSLDGKNTEFPFSNVVFSGGAVSKILSAEYDPKHSRQSDVDLFVFANNFEERSRLFKEVIDWFTGNANDVYYAIRGSVVSIYVKNIPRKFQVISIAARSSHEIINRFDLSHIQWFYADGKFSGSPEAYRSMRERVSHFNNDARLRVPRLIKALYHGYSIKKEEIITSSNMDITTLIADVHSPQLQKVIRGLHGWFYPRDMPEMEADEEVQYNLSMIENDSHATFVTTDPKFVIDNTTIGGNFENDYESINFETFNPATVDNCAWGRNVDKIVLKSKNVPIKLMTDVMKVSAVDVAADTSVSIQVDVTDDKFKEFCNTLQTKVYKMLRGAGDVRSIILNNHMSFKISVHRIAAAVRGHSCIRSQRGEKLDIKDLTEGDNIQVMFAIELFNDRHIELRPIHLIRHQKYDREKVLKLQGELNADNNELLRILADSKPTKEITYAKRRY